MEQSDYANLGVIVSWLIMDPLARRRFVRWYKEEQPNIIKARTINQVSVVGNLLSLSETLRKEGRFPAPKLQD